MRSEKQKKRAQNAQPETENIKAPDPAPERENADEQAEPSEGKPRFRMWQLLCLLAVFFVLLASLVVTRSIRARSAKERLRYETIAGSAEASEEETAPNGQKLSVNVNTADEAELCLLPDIGEQRARAIIDCREVNGSYTSPEDLLSADGIGESVLEKIRPYIQFSDSPSLNENETQPTTRDAAEDPA